MPVRLREIVELVAVDVHAARCDFVQQRLPHMRARAIDEDYVGLPALAEGVAQAGREFQAARSAADDDDAMRTSAHACARCTALC